MNNVVAHLEYLLTCNDCVVIPNIGAILVRYVPARYDSSVGVFYPPCRQLSFNGALAENDGVLVSSISRAKAVSYEVASKIVSYEVDAMKHQLTIDGRLSLGVSVGQLVQDATFGTVVFESAGFQAASSQAWLKPLSIESPNNEVESVGNDVTLADLRNESKRLSRKAFLRANVRKFVAGAAAMLAFVALTFLLLPRIAEMADENETQCAAMYVSASQTQDKLPERRSSSALVLILQPHDDAVTTVDLDKGTVDVEDVALQNVDTEKYVMVIASLISESEAEKFVSENKNLQNLEVLNKDGRYRVYAVSGNSIAEVKEKARLLDLERLYPSAWICRK